MLRSSSISLLLHSSYGVRAIRLLRYTGKGGKNRRRGKGDGEESKRELEFKEDGEFCRSSVCSSRLVGLAPRRLVR